METIAYADFEKVQIRAGRIVEARDFPEARKPAYRLLIDFGPEIGTLRSSAQIVKHYSPEELLGRLVLGVVNFPPKQIGPFLSECLIVGFADANGDIVLAQPEREVPLGAMMF